MGIGQFFHEIKAKVSHKRMFKAVKVENADVLPKASPFIKSPFINSKETIQGDGGVGSIKKTNFSEGKHMKKKIDHLDHGDVLGDHIESISHELKIERSKDGGCVVKITTLYHTKGGVVLKEEDIKASKEQFFEIYKAYADYLNANPHVSA